MKKYNLFRHGLSLLVIAGMILLAFGSSDDSSSGSSSSSSSSSHLVVPNKKYRIETDTIGFRSKENYEKYLQFFEQKDREAANNFGAACLLTGEAGWFNADDTVFVSDTSVWSNMAKVHKTGEIVEYWVLMSFLIE